MRSQVSIELLKFQALLQATYGQASRRQSDQLSDIWYSQSLQISAFTIVVKRSSIQRDITPNSDTRRE